MRSVIILLLAAATWVQAQSIENWVELSGQPEDLQLWLDELREHPLDLNRAGAQELAKLPFFDEAAAYRLIKERESRGYFASLQDALDAESLTKEQKEILREFTGVDIGRPRRVSVRSVAGIGRASGKTPAASDWWSSERADFFSGENSTGYVFLKRKTGDADFARYAAGGIRFSIADETAEIILGDYQYEAGTGLLFATSSGMANWVSSFDARGPGTARNILLRPSSNRNSLYRGAAATLAYRSVRFSLLGSQSPRDAVTDTAGPIRLCEGETTSSSELAEARRDRIREDLVGASGEITGASWRIGAAAAELRYRPSLHKDTGIQDVPQFSGNTLRTRSAYGSANLWGMDFMTEIAKSDPGGIAHQSAIAAGGKRAGIAAYYLYAAEDFYSPHGNLWGGFAAVPVNSQVGGIRIRSVWEKHSLHLNAAVSRTPFRTASQPLRNYGGELNARWRTVLLEPLDAELYLGRKWREDARETESITDVNADRARCDFIYSDGPAQYRIRLELSSVWRSAHSHRAAGSLIFFQVKSGWRNYEGFGRLTLFHRESADVSMPVYENALSGSHPLITLGSSGSRVAVMVSRKIQPMRLAFKVAHTRAESGTSTELAFEAAYGR